MKLYRSFATVGGLTLMSRVLGFVRDILLAAILGTGPVAEAFVVAFRFPNLFRRWFGEGAFNAAFIPLFAKRLEGEGRDAARAFAEQAMVGAYLHSSVAVGRVHDRNALADVHAGAGFCRHARRSSISPC